MATSQVPRMGRKVAVKNKSAASVQISAEQIIREAMERVEAEPKAPRQRITDEEELSEFRTRKRKEFEDAVRRARGNIGAWLKYAAWEATHNEFDRARSIFERALEVDYRNQTLWLKYAEMEMKNKFVNSARNVWDRAVKILPRVDQFWYKYAYMEEMLANLAAARQIFERWMEWMPDYNAWNSYVKFELRHNNVELCRQIFERWLAVHPEVRTYLKYASFEEKHGSIQKGREIYERALAELGEEAIDEELFITFAKFEEKNREFERARVIYKYAMDNLPKHRVQELYQTYTSFEKMFGDREGVEEVILSKRRFQYEEEIKANPRNYDVWFDYLRLEEQKGDQVKIRQIYERAIANVPPTTEKRFWKRYMYLWLNFAVYEELVAKDIDRAREVYEEALKIVPHATFTFSKLWLLYAKFEVRRKELDRARKVLGTALGKCPKEKIFRGYIELELQLGNIDRCRKLYEKYLEVMPDNCYAWSKYAELESSLHELDRARAIFEMAVNQPLLDMPELLWKAYIDFEIKLNQHDHVRQLYTRLLQRTKHVKVWISRAQFEASLHEYARARQVFNDAEVHFKELLQSKEERVLLLEAWLDFEKNFGDAQTLKAVQERLPKKIKKKRLLKNEEGEEAGWEEYYDYIFPDEEKATGGLAILERARMWKKHKAMESNDEQTEDTATGMDVEPDEN